MHFDLALAGYILALLHSFFFFSSGNRRLILTGNIAAGFGVLMNLAAFIVQWRRLGYFPTNNMSDVLVLLCLGFGVTYLFLYYRFRRPTMGMFILPIVVVLGIFSMILPSASGAKPAATSMWLYIHLPFTILGTALFLVATVTSVMYFIQERQLKKKNFSGIIFRRFPPLDVINRVINTTLMLGFYCFTIGLIAGIAWMSYKKGHTGIFSPKLSFAVITWLIFASVSFLKNWRGLSPKDTAIVTVVGALSVIITYVGVAVFLMG